MTTDNNTPSAPETVAEVVTQEGVTVVATSEPTPEPVKKTRKKRNNKSGNFLIFKLAKEKGLPDRHADLAVLLGKKPAAFSMIIHDKSDGDATFRAKLAEVFPGYTLDQLRAPVEEMPTPAVETTPEA